MTVGNRGCYNVPPARHSDAGLPDTSFDANGACRSRGRIHQGTFVNKSEMIDSIARHADISKAAAGRALDAVVSSIKASLKKGDVVTLVGFGSFFVGKRSARAGRNPRTNEPIKIRAAKVPKFRAGKALKDAVN